MGPSEPVPPMRPKALIKALLRKYRNEERLIEALGEVASGRWVFAKVEMALGWNTTRDGMPMAELPGQVHYAFLVNDPEANHPRVSAVPLWPTKTEKKQLAKVCKALLASA